MEYFFYLVGIVTIIGFIAKLLEDRSNKELVAETDAPLSMQTESQPVDHEYVSTSSTDVNSDENYAESNGTADNNSEIEDYECRTKEIIEDSLKQLGCQPKLQDDGLIHVDYQGEGFDIDCSGFFARIWDPFWIKLNINDPRMSNFKDAVNKTNFSFGPTIVLTKPDDDGNIYAHSRLDIMIHPSCTENVMYIKSMMDSFFNIHYNLHENFNGIEERGQQQAADAQNNRRPVGFQTNTENE
jgi:hypothetical protein